MFCFLIHNGFRFYRRWFKNILTSRIHVYDCWESNKLKSWEATSWMHSGKFISRRPLLHSTRKGNPEEWLRMTTTFTERKQMVHCTNAVTCMAVLLSDVNENVNNKRGMLNRKKNAWKTHCNWMSLKTSQTINRNANCTWWSAERHSLCAINVCRTCIMMFCNMNGSSRVESSCVKQRQ